MGLKMTRNGLNGISSESGISNRSTVIEVKFLRHCMHFEWLAASPRYDTL